MAEKNRTFPLTVGVAFKTEKDMIDFFEMNFKGHSTGSVGLFKADALDPEFGGRAHAHAYVVRNLDQARADDPIAEC